MEVENDRSSKKISSKNDKKKNKVKWKLNNIYFI